MPKSGWREYLGAAVGGAISAIPVGCIGDAIIIGGFANVADGLISGEIDENNIQDEFVRGGFNNSIGYGFEKMTSVIKAARVSKMPKTARKSFLKTKVYHSKQSAVNTNYHAFNSMKLSSKAAVLSSHMKSYRLGVRASTASSMIALIK